MDEKDRFPGLCDRPQTSRFFFGARVCDNCGWARKHHPSVTPVADTPNERGGNR